MEVHQVIEAGKLTSSYLSSYNNQLQLTVEGGHEINMKVPEDELRDLANRLNERVEYIDNERKEKLEAEALSAAEAKAEAEDSLADLPID
jgi:predicted AlkP superfamily phosphohydrolase/phosphomutase